MDDMKITVHVATKDRPTELALMLQSLRTQTKQNWDIIIYDDASKTPLVSVYFINEIINRIKLEGHKVKIRRGDVSYGCCYARNECIKIDDFENSLTLRLDDDIILEDNYIEMLLETIKKGYDMVTGVIPNLGHPVIKRKTEHVTPIINEHKLNDKGDIVMNKDDCGFCYMDDKIIPTHQFRTNCLYKSEINEKVKYPETLTTVAFREEGFFSMSALLEGYKLAVRTGAVCWHLRCPGGGNRRNDYAECVKIDDETFRKWIKQKFYECGDFLSKYNKEIL